MAADRSAGNLVILDASVAAVLWLAACLPAGALWSDFVIGGIHTAYVAAHGFLASQGGAPFKNCQVLAVFAMASAGIHTVAVTGFLITTFAAAPFLYEQWDFEQLASCIYVLVLSVILERRVAQLVSDRNANIFSYKALNLISNHQGDMYYDMATPTTSNQLGHEYNYSALMSRDTAGPLSRGTGGAGSDIEDAVVPPATSTSSRSSLADYVLSRMAPAEASGRAGYVFSRLLPGSQQQGRVRPPTRFAAAQVQMPGAATHEAPAFRDKSREICRKAVDEAAIDAAAVAAEAGLSDNGRQIPQPPPREQQQSDQDSTLDSPSSKASLLPKTGTRGADGSCQADASPPPSSRKTVFRGVKLTGFRNSGLNELFVENSDVEFMINGRETYWSSSGDYFLYRSEATNTWGAAKAKRFKQVREGSSNGVAHSPEGFEIWQTAAMLAKKAWREWDAEENKWVTRQGSGVESRGKVRKKDAPFEKGTQTELSVEEKAVQTDPHLLPNSH